MDIYKQHKEGLIAPRHNLGLEEHSKEIFEQLNNVMKEVEEFHKQVSVVV